MKALLKFLLNTGVGRTIVQAIVAFIISIVKKKIDKLEGYKRDNLNSVLDIVHDELCADLETGAIKPTDMI
jgi:hypothetical protein